MFGGRLLFASDLRACPLCGSEGVIATEAAKLDCDNVRLTLRCGGCRTWRAYIVPSRRAVPLARACARMLDHDRAEIARALRRGSVAAGTTPAPPKTTPTTDGGR